MTGQLSDEIEWFPFTAITGAQHHRPNDLIAFACEDLSIRVIDIVTKKTVREFHGCEGGINDFVCNVYPHIVPQVLIFTVFLE